MRSALLVLALVSACAHAAAPQRAAKATERVLVTGSHIPRPVDPDSGVPQTFDAIRIYSRDRLTNTGRGSDLRAALRDLDPSF